MFPSDIEQAIAGRETWATDRLAAWVSHASTLGNEAPAQIFIAGVLDEMGLEVREERIDIDQIRALPGFSPVEWSYDGRPNVVGIHDSGPGQGRSLILNGHVDVVSPEPVKLWSVEPFQATVVADADGQWMTGRGAGDMKGGTMSYLWALSALRDAGLEPASKVIVQSVIEEECTGNGTLSLCAKGYRADGCLIPEPFGETVLERQVGVIWFQVRILGKTTHVLGAGSGVNAIEKAWKVIQALHALEEEVNRPQSVPDGYREIAHPINLNVGVIRGGDWASTVPGECLVQCRFGLFPGESIPRMMARIENAVKGAAQGDPWLERYVPRVEYVGFQAEGACFEPRSPLGAVLAKAHETWRGQPPALLASTATTDTRFFNLYYGIPATCYGPVARDIHAADERVSIDSMRRVALVLTSVIAHWCGLRKAAKR